MNRVIIFFVLIIFSCNTKTPRVEMGSINSSRVEQRKQWLTNKLPPNSEYIKNYNDRWDLIKIHNDYYYLYTSTHSEVEFIKIDKEDIE